MPDRSSGVKSVAPSLKSTFPVGVPLPGASALTLAVKITFWPKTEGLTEEIKVVAVAAWLTTWLTKALLA